MRLMPDRDGMEHTNIEIKAKCIDQDKIRAILKSRNADFRGSGPSN